MPQGRQMCVAVGVMDLVLWFKTALAQSDFEVGWVRQLESTRFATQRSSHASPKPAFS